MPNEDALRSLSNEELQALEGMERANVEARIALLRNVQKLLDAAVTQLNQYSTIMAAMGSVDRQERYTVLLTLGLTYATF